MYILDYVNMIYILRTYYTPHVEWFIEKLSHDSGKLGMVRGAYSSLLSRNMILKTENVKIGVGPS